MPHRPAAPLTLLALALLAGCAPLDPDHVEGKLVVVKENGGWCWFMHPRAIVDEGRILVGTVAAANYGGSQRGDAEVTSFDPAGGARASFKVHPLLENDDHDSPSVRALPDGRYLAMYTRHARDQKMRWRISERAGDISAWGPEMTVTDEGPGQVTYSNTFVLSGEANQIYNFYRARDQNPFVMTAAPESLAFTPVGRLLHWDQSAGTGADPAKLTGVTERTRPYVRYASNDVDTVHFITTEDHPSAYDTSVYHGYIRGGRVYGSTGDVVDESLRDFEAASPVDFTRVFAGDADHVAWTVDLELDAEGRPFMVFSVQRDGADTREEKGGGAEDHRYYHARFDGARWQVHEMAYAGTNLARGQDDYTGLAALVPGDPDTVFISTNADPASGDPLMSRADGERHHEIFRGHTTDQGATWAWTAITSDSTTDHLRPVIPRWAGHTAVLWLRGKYHSMHRYEQDVVGVVDP